KIVLERRIVAEIFFDIAAVLDDRYRWNGLGQNFSLQSLDRNLDDLAAMTPGANRPHFSRQAGDVHLGEIGVLVTWNIKQLWSSDVVDAPENAAMTSRGHKAAGSGVY